MERSLRHGLSGWRNQTFPPPCLGWRGKIDALDQVCREDFIHCIRRLLQCVLPGLPLCHQLRQIAAGNDSCGGLVEVRQGAEEVEMLGRDVKIVLGLARRRAGKIEPRFA